MKENRYSVKKIIIKRPEESSNQSITYKIFIGKKKWTELRNGEEKTIEIPAETQEKFLKAKIQWFSWFGSNKMDIKPLSDKETFIIRGNDFLNRKAVFIVALLPLTGVFMFGYGRDNIVVKNIGIGLFVLLLLFIIGIATLWRNKWLNITRK